MFVKLYTASYTATISYAYDNLLKYYLPGQYLNMSLDNFGVVLPCNYYSWGWNCRWMGNYFQQSFTYNAWIFHKSKEFNL